MTKKVRILIIMALFLVVLVVAAYFVHGFLNGAVVYTGYTTLRTTDRADSMSASYVQYGDGFLRYSKDGIAYYNADSVPQWNASYELQQPMLDIRGDYCAVAGIGGSWIYVFNKAGAVMSVDAVLPIVTVSVAANGCVVAVLEEGNTQYIDMYDTAGDRVYRIKTTISGNGVPMALSISDDAIKLMVAYADIENNSISTSVAFYNFGEIGKNMSERLVGGFDQYEGMLIPDVHFLTSDTAIAVATGKLSIYTIDQYPKLMSDITFEEELHGIFYSSQYIGLIFQNHESGYPYRILVYDMKGTMTGEIPVDADYKNYCFSGDSVLMYDDNDVRIVGIDGKEHFRYTFENAIDSFIPVENDNTFVYINSRKVQKIRLTQ